MPRLTEEQVKRLTSYKPEEITRSVMIDLFSPTPVPDGKRFKIKAPYMAVSDMFTLTPSMSPIVNKSIETSAGLYLFNLVCIQWPFGGSIGYFNETLTPSVFDKFHKKMMQLLIDKKVTTEQIGMFYTNMTFMSSFCEIYSHGLSTKFLGIPKEVKALKEKLIKEHADIIASNDTIKYVEMVEKPLLAEAEKILSKDPAWPLIEFNKGKFFNNNYKNNCITNGSIWDTVNNKFVISTNSYTDGIEPDKYHIYANLSLSGTYARNIETQYGGAQTKYMFSAMQYSILDKKGSDCGTTMTLPIKITNDNKDFYIYRYFVEDGQIKHMTREIVGDYVGKIVNFRSPLFCKSPNVCNHCFNSLYYDIGITNAGLTSTRPTASIMYIAMKAMHDSTVKTVRIKLQNYISVIK